MKPYFQVLFQEYAKIKLVLLNIIIFVLMELFFLIYSLLDEVLLDEFHQERAN